MIYLYPVRAIYFAFAKPILFNCFELECTKCFSNCKINMCRLVQSSYSQLHNILSLSGVSGKKRLEILVCGGGGLYKNQVLGLTCLILLNKYDLFPVLLVFMSIC